MVNQMKITQAIGDLEENDVMEMLEAFVSSNPSEDKVQEVVIACQEGMAIVGSRFETNEYYVADLVYAGELLNKAFAMLKPLINESDSNISIKGTIVLGTVHGDLHDIGKNIFKNMVEASGFVVHDLGIDQPVESFVKKVKEVKPDIVGLSGLLTISLTSMKETIEGLEKAGLRKKAKVIIGGNPVDESTCKQIRADGYTNNASEGVNICKQWV